MIIYLNCRGFNFTAAQVVCITAMMNHKFISSPQFKYNYDLSYIHLHYHAFVTNTAIVFMKSFENLI